MEGSDKGSRMTEGMFRQREKTDRGEVQAKGANGWREGIGKGSRLAEGRSRQREQTDRGKVQAKGAE